jgi:hypothetical protein
LSFVPSFAPFFTSFPPYGAATVSSMATYSVIK